ncbi:MAG TPA: CocE/NonD family hydrolase [Chloroflexia bacterium]|nr:CocE/NonD family hydrolase [Chloroflexia bacterium]
MEATLDRVDISLKLLNSSAGRSGSLPRRGVRYDRLARGAAVAGLGLAGLVFGGFPMFAARRIIYPTWSDEYYRATTGKLEMDLPVRPEYVVFEGRDGKALSGWFVPAPEGSAKPWPVVMLAYGYGGFKEQMAGYSRSIHEGGFATFLFDMSGSGLRKGEPGTFGYKERWQMMDAANYLRTRDDVDPGRIGALGVSMGAAATLLAAAEDPGIKAVVADSSYADLFGMVRPGISAFISPRALFLAPLIVRYAETMLGMKSGEVRHDEAAARLGDRPLFIIHGDCDTLTDPNSATRLYDAASGPKQLWVVNECGHAYAPVLAPDEYKQRVNGFFQRYL